MKTAIRRVVGLAMMVMVVVAARPIAADDADGPPTPPSLTMRGGTDPRIQSGIDLIYNLRFAEADRYFGTIIAEDPDNPLGHFFLAMVTWWRVLIDLDNRAYDEAFYALLERCIDVCDRRLEENPDDFDSILFKGGAIGFRGRLRGDRHQFVRAARDGLRCLPLLKKSRQLEPTNKDILFGQGIYNYFADVIPQRHPVVRPAMWFLEDGDRELGLSQLEEVGREGHYARAEALYFLVQIHRVFEEDDAGALPYLVELHERYPDNALFHRYRARTLVSLGRWDEGVAIYEDVVRRSRAGAPGYHTRGHIEALFYVGKHAFRKHRLDDCVLALTAADRLSYQLGGDVDEQAARGYVSLANLYLGMALAEQGLPEAALARYERVLELPARGRSHELAKSYRKSHRGGQPSGS